MIGAGALAALGAAAVWALATHAFRLAGGGVPALELNFWKGLFASLLLGLTLFAQGGGLAGLSAADTGWLLLSGVIGIGVGDTAFFRALATLGTRRTLLFETLAPPVAALQAWLLLDERLGAVAWLGLGLTVAGVAWVIAERAPATGAPGAGPPVSRLAGVGWGLLAATCQATGMVIARGVLVQNDLPASASALLRLLAGVVVLGIWLLARRRPLELWKRRGERRLLGLVAAGTVLGTWMGLWLQQAALARIPAGVAQTLLATSPVIAVLLAAAAGRRPSARAWLGALLALAGVALLV